MRAAVLAIAFAVAAAAQTNPRASLLNPAAPEFSAPAPAVSTVRLDTTRGTIDIEVRASRLL